MPRKYPDHLERELRKVRIRQDEARREQAAQGSTREGLIEAGMRAALQHGMDHLEPSLTNFEKGLGVPIDAGSFFLGMQASACAIEGVDIIALTKDPMGKRLLLEFIEKARETHG